VEIIDIDPTTKEILTNEVFRWDPVTDKFIYSGKSYVLERVRKLYDMDKEQMIQELRKRVIILNWMRKNNVREFKDVAKAVSLYAEVPDRLMEQVKKDAAFLKDSDNEEERLVKQKSEETGENELVKPDKKERNEPVKLNKKRKNKQIKLDKKEIHVKNVEKKKHSFFFKRKKKKESLRRDLP